MDEEAEKMEEAKKIAENIAVATEKYALLITSLAYEIAAKTCELKAVELNLTEWSGAEIAHDCARRIRRLKL